MCLPRTTNQTFSTASPHPQCAHWGETFYNAAGGIVTQKQNQSYSLRYIVLIAVRYYAFPSEHFEVLHLFEQHCSYWLDHTPYPLWANEIILTHWHSAPRPILSLRITNSQFNTWKIPAVYQSNVDTLVTEAQGDRTGPSPAMERERALHQSHHTSYWE